MSHPLAGASEAPAAEAARTHAAERLDAGPTGRIVRPDDMDWDLARAAWAANVDQQPAAVALVHSVDDVAAVVASAGGRGLKVMAQGTGHGAAPVESLDHTVLVRTASLDRVEIDPVARTAWCGAGADWRAVTTAAAKHGLAAQAGSAGSVGITGYFLSGGISWLSRLHGLAVNDVTQLQVVTADGQIRTVDTDHDPELFWALRGGGGSLAVVTGLQLRLHAIPTVAAGSLFFPISRAGEILHTWRRWIRGLSEHTMSCGRLLQFPPLPELPPPLRGQAFAAIEIAHQGPLAELTAAIPPLRDLGPSLDTIAEIPTAALDQLHMDPPGPTPFRGNGTLLTDAPTSAIDTLVAHAGHGSGSPLQSIELRHLGGALRRRPPHAGAVGHLHAEFLMYAVGITPDAATAAKVDAHIGIVEHALAPWFADRHYANLDERAPGGRSRFHDPATLKQLVTVKTRVDPTGLLTSGHRLLAR